MATNRVIDTLNKAITLEHAAVIQYKQHGLLVRGLWRKVFAEYFAESCGAQEHAHKFGQKVVALGGVPTVEVGMVRQSLDVEEMLRQDLELEREAMQAYLEAHALAAATWRCGPCSKTRSRMSSAISKNSNPISTWCARARSSRKSIIR